MAIRLPKSIFLHVPKCGGTWVRKALHACGLVQEELVKHVTLAEAQAIPSGAWNGLPGFAFVRHPIAWYRSYWAFKVEVGWDARNGLDNFIRADDFETFVRNCIREKPGLAGTIFDMFTKGASYVGRMEVLRESLIHILSKVGEQFDPAVIYSLPADNVRSSRPQLEPRCRYSPTLLAELIEVEKATIERYGYSFVNPNP